MNMLSYGQNVYSANNVINRLVSLFPWDLDKDFIGNTGKRMKILTNKGEKRMSSCAM